MEKEMSAWDLGNKISEISCRLDGIAGILEILGENISANAESGACWTCAEWIKQYGDELENLASDVMRLELPKGKKK